MIEKLLKNERFLAYFPPVAGVAIAAMFVSLGLWQLDRAAERNALLAMFDDDQPYIQPSDFGSLEEFDRIEFFGQYEGERQILIDNIPLEGRLGYYVITPFRPASDGRLLLVNRGWTPRGMPGDALPDLSVDKQFTTLQGLVGHLPRVAIRPGEAFDVRGPWPRVAVYPTLDEVASELGEEVLPVVLLLSPQAAGNFLRNWQPNIRGPMTNYSYAFQWFALAAATLFIVGWHMRKRLRRERDQNR